MASNNGTIVLMGSGELTATMVEVHKALLASLGDHPKAVFLDTPAGFQPNVDQISAKAIEYFRTRVHCTMETASFKSKDDAHSVEAARGFQKLREARYILIGPGSPTYAVRQWRESPVPGILTNHLERGNCLVAASAAALTIGRLTLPVYEIYKVGEQLHWVEGMNILGAFGFNLVVIPHWNNAEGGTHDTRFCFMGEQRLRSLEALLPTDTAILGVEEHTACRIDLANEDIRIEGMGDVILRCHGRETVFSRGERYSIDMLRGKGAHGRSSATAHAVPSSSKEIVQEPFWDSVHTIERRINEGLENNDARKAVRALLDLDYTIWKGSQDLESEEFITQAREILRELIVLLATKMEACAKERNEILDPLVEELLRQRNQFREQEQWAAADAIRECLEKVNIAVEDGPDGSRWRTRGEE